MASLQMKVNKDWEQSLQLIREKIANPGGQMSPKKAAGDPSPKGANKLLLKPRGILQIKEPTKQPSSAATLDQTKQRASIRRHKSNTTFLQRIRNLLSQPRGSDLSMRNITQLSKEKRIECIFDLIDNDPKINLHTGVDEDAKFNTRETLNRLCKKQILLIYLLELISSGTMYIFTASIRVAFSGLVVYYWENVVFKGDQKKIQEMAEANASLHHNITSWSRIAENAKIDYFFGTGFSIGKVFFFNSITFLLYIVYRGTLLWGEVLKCNLQVKKRQIILSLLFRRMEKSDTRTLEKTDNIMITRLFYNDLDVICQRSGHGSEIFPLFVTTFFIVRFFFESSYLMMTTAYSILAFIFLTVLWSCFSTEFSWTSKMQVYLEKVKMLQELIVCFKGIKTRNLTARYERHLKKIRQSETSLMKKATLFQSLVDTLKNNVAIIYILAVGIVYQAEVIYPMRYANGSSVESIRYDEQTGFAIIAPPLLLKYMNFANNFISLIALLLFFEDSITEVCRWRSQSKDKKVAEDYFDKFFSDNNKSLYRHEDDRVDIPLGSVCFENLCAYEKLHPDQKENIELAKQALGQGPFRIPTLVEPPLEPREQAFGSNNRSLSPKRRRSIFRAEEGFDSGSLSPVKKKVDLDGTPTNALVRKISSQQANPKPSPAPRKLNVRDFNFKLNWFSKDSSTRKVRMENVEDAAVKLKQPQPSNNEELATDKITLLEGVTCDILPGDKVCLYGEDNYSGQEEFLRIILGEGIIKAGTAAKHGKISTLNTADSWFIIGSTIFSNIVLDEAFNQERYSRVLSLLNLTFSRYNGGDAYQIAEGASNISVFDSKLILIARFLYQTADIYIIQNLFGEKSAIPGQINLPGIIKDFLGDKTVIFITRDKRLMSQATRILVFSENQLQSIEDAQTYLKNLNFKVFVKDQVDSDEDFYNAFTPEKEQKENIATKGFTFKQRAFNTFLLKNFSIDHELALHKKSQAQKSKTDSILKGALIVEKLVYGIYLAQKKRDEGRNLVYDNHNFSKGEIWIFLKKYLGLTAGNLWFTFGSCLVVVLGLTYIQVTVFGVFTHLIYKPFYKITGNFELNNSLILGAVFFVCVTVSIILRCKLKLSLIQRTSKVHDAMLEGLLNNDYIDHQKYRNFTLLRLFETNMNQIEKEAIESVIDIVVIMISFCSCILLLLIIHGIFYLVVLLLVVLFCWDSFKKLVQMLLIILPINSTVSEKVHNHYYQITTRIAISRRKGTLDQELQSFQKVSNNWTLINYDIFFDISSWVMLRVQNFNMLHMFIIVCFTIIFAKGYSITLTHQVFFAGYSIILVCMFSIKLRFIFQTIAFLITKSAGLVSIHTFLSQQNEKEKRRTELTAYGRRDLSFLKSDRYSDFAIVLKGIYLTLGSTIILKNISTKIVRGNKVCLLGSDGVGRSYVFNIIAGLFRPDKVLDEKGKEKSEIWILGNKIKESTVLSDITKNIDMLEIHPTLFEGTVRDNIDPEYKFTDLQIIRILKLLSKKHKQKIADTSPKGLSVLPENPLSEKNDDNSSNDSPAKRFARKSSFKDASRNASPGNHLDKRLVDSGEVVLFKKERSFDVDEKSNRHENLESPRKGKAFKQLELNLVPRPKSQSAQLNKITEGENEVDYTEDDPYGALSRKRRTETSSGHRKLDQVSNRYSRSKMSSSAQIEIVTIGLSTENANNQIVSDPSIEENKSYRAPYESITQHKLLSEMSSKLEVKNIPIEVNPSQGQNQNSSENESNTLINKFNSIKSKSLLQLKNLGVIEETEEQESNLPFSKPVQQISLGVNATFNIPEDQTNQNSQLPLSSMQASSVTGKQEIEIINNLSASKKFVSKNDTHGQKEKLAFVSADSESESASDCICRFDNISDYQNNGYANSFNASHSKAQLLSKLLIHTISASADKPCSLEKDQPPSFNHQLKVPSSAALFHQGEDSNKEQIDKLKKMKSSNEYVVTPMKSEANIGEEWEIGAPKWIQTQTPSNETHPLQIPSINVLPNSNMTSIEAKNITHQESLPLRTVASDVSMNKMNSLLIPSKFFCAPNKNELNPQSRFSYYKSQTENTPTEQEAVCKVVLEKLKIVDPANDIQIIESPKHSSAGRFSHSNEPSKKRIFSNLHDQKKNLQPSLQNSTIPSTAAKPSTISPPHSGSLEKSQVTKKFAEEEISQEDIAHYSQLLNLKVGFTGKNLDVETRRYINCCRCLLKEPEIILFWEDSLNFGDGVEANLVRLFREANTSTILAITRNCKNVLAYDQVILMDNGTVAETGNPRLLMANNESILFSFVKETDPDSFKDVKKDLKYLKNKSECTSLTQSQHGDQTSMKSFNECAQNYRRPNRGNTYNRQAAEDFRRRNKSSLAAFKESNSRSFHIQQI